jgi:hypothetical protein
MVKRKIPDDREPENKSAKSTKRRNPKVRFSKAGYVRVKGSTVKDRQGYIWRHILTADEPEVKRLALFYKRQGKHEGYDFKIERDGYVYTVFIRKE